MIEGGASSSDSALRRVGEYELLEAIGRGATGTVYRARSVSTGEPVALKMLHGGASADSVARFAREIAIAERLVHRNLVGVLDTGFEDGAHYLVMELLRGKSLVEIIRGRADDTNVARVLDLVAQVCLGLHHAHEQGLVHRDVKPANVFVTDEGVAKVLDFGVAKLADTTTTVDGTLVGTLAYMAPEQLQTRVEIDGRADVFSAGVILYEMLTGRRPFDADSSAAILARILSEEPEPLPAGSHRLQALVDRALAKDPDHRFVSAQAFAHALWAVQLEARAPARPPAALEEEIAPTLVSAAPTPGSAQEIPAEVEVSVRAPEWQRWIKWIAAVGIGAALILVGVAWLWDGATP